MKIHFVCFDKIALEEYKKNIGKKMNIRMEDIYEEALILKVNGNQVTIKMTNNEISKAMKTIIEGHWGVRRSIAHAKLDKNENKKNN